MKRKRNDAGDRGGGSRKRSRGGIKKKSGSRGNRIYGSSRRLPDFIRLSVFYFFRGADSAHEHSGYTHRESTLSVSPELGVLPESTTLIRSSCKCVL